MKSFSSLLKKFDNTLQKYNPVNYARLQPPLPKGEIKDYIESFGIHDNGELNELFGWKNGFDFSEGEDESFQIFDYGALLSLQHLALYISHVKKPKFDSTGKLVFLPLTTNGGGETLLYNINKQQYGQIYLFSVPLFFIDEPISYYDSLYSMIETAIKAYEEKIFTYNEEDDWLDTDFDAYHSLAGKMNPKSEYWKKNK